MRANDFLRPVPNYIIEVDGVKRGEILINLLEAEAMNSKLVDDVDLADVKQLNAFSKLSDPNPTVGKSYIPVVLFYSSKDFVRLLGSKNPKKLLSIDGNEFTFEEIGTFPHERLTTASFLKMFMFSSKENYNKFLTLISLKYKLSVNLQEAVAPAEPAIKKLGRAFNHLEDLVFFHGSAGTMEALEHLKEIGTEAGSKTVRMKWDGNPQIYWGREKKGGPLVLAGHNGWSRGALTSSPEEVEDFIANKSGSPKSPEEKANRDAFAKQFASLYPLFDAATPKEFVGFVYADGLYLQRPQVDQEGVFSFSPNPKSKTTYHVLADSPLGRAIAQSQVMVVGHAYFPEFGMPDEAQKPMDDFSMFNTNPALIVQGPVYNSNPVAMDTAVIDSVEQYLHQHAKAIDGFLQGTAGLGDLKNILYTYVNQTAKGHQLDSLSAQHFFNWLKTSKVSLPKQTKIEQLAQSHKNSLDAIFGLVTRIMNLKDQVIDQVEQGRGEIWDTHGEGRVRYADQNKQFGNVKLVPRKRWTPQ